MDVSMTGIENGKEVIATGGFGGSGGLGGSCSFWNVYESYVCSIQIK